MIKTSVRAMAIMSLILLTTGCVSNTFLGYGKVRKNAPYAALIPARRAMGAVTLGDSGYYVTGVTLRDTNAYQGERTLSLEAEAPFSWPMCIINVIPLTWMSMAAGEIQRAGRSCYRVPPGSYSFSVDYMHFAVTEKRSHPNGYELWGYKTSHKRDITATIEPGKTYYLAPEYDAAIMTEQEWKALSSTKAKAEAAGANDTGQQHQQGEERRFE